MVLPGLGDIGTMLRRADLALAIGVMAILVILILPLPPMLLDLALAISIILSVLILMTALFIQAPLEFSAFPTILLIATMLRLALNLASTRLILARGHEGTAAAGHVIEAFGNFVMSGNFVIGIIVFTILVIVNFVVITKGSGRIAEVAARFHLDAMPGKQMAIDADLSAGLIDETRPAPGARQLEDESGFFGAMDGASKFVRGDAIAGLLVVFINIIGGMIIGIAQQGMPFAEAARTYTLLTVGDGLVTQVPALIVSTAAGLLVTKAGHLGFGRRGADEAALRLSQGARHVGGRDVRDGAAARHSRCCHSWRSAAARARSPTSSTRSSGGRSWRRTRRSKPPQRRPPPRNRFRPRSRSTSSRSSSATRCSRWSMRAGSSDRLTEQIKALRRSLAIDLGFVMPAVRILDNVQLEANTYVVKIKEVDAGTGRIWPGQFMVMDPNGGQVSLPGIHTSEPTFGLPATWVDVALKEDAAIKGYTVVDAATVLSTHLTELIKGNVSELLSYAEVSKLIKELPKEQGELIKDIVPTQITLSGIQRVLQFLLAERISIRDLATILEGIAEAIPGTRNPATLAEHVRARLGRQICAQHTTPSGYLPLIALSAKWEQAFAESIVGQGDDRASRHAAVEADRVRHPHSAAVRGGRAGRGVAGAGDLGRHPAVRPQHRGAVPGPDPGPLPGRNPRPGAAQDGRQHLGPG